MPNSPVTSDSDSKKVQSTAVNEALLISGLREHELRETAEHLAEKLRREIEQREKADQLVRTSEIRFRRLFETAESGIITLDFVSMLITDANPFFCKLVEYSREELIGKELWAVKLFGDEDLRVLFLKLKKASHISEDLPLKTKLGRMIQVGLVGNLYEEGGAEVVQCNFRDVTDSKNLLAVARAASLAAEKANSTKDIFLAALSHELRTPLNPALLLASEGASNPNLDPEVRKDFAAIEKNILLEAGLIDELLDFTKIVRGKISLRMETLSLNKVLRDAVANVQAEIDGKHLTLSIKTRSGDPAVMGDSLRLQQVFWNLLKNAAKFTPQGGRISVETAVASSENRVVMEFSDTGIGIDPSELHHIFEPFQQGDHSRSGGPKKFGGLGLGLAIARNILELHSGTIHATSKGIGCGSIFTVELPLESPEGSKPPNSSPRTGTPFNAGDHRIKVLFVEDDPESRTVTGRLLEARGFDVSSAESFTRALWMGSQHSFDLLITDIGLPDGNGLDLLELCARTSPKIRGIAISGYGMDSDRNLSKTAKFSAHLVKPVGIGELEGALRTAVTSNPPYANTFGVSP